MRAITGLASVTTAATLWHAFAIRGADLMVTPVYDALPWSEIRRRWEMSAISLAALAVEFGIQSVTTLKRRRTSEDWVHDRDALEARRPMADTAFEGVAEMPRDDASGDFSNDQAGVLMRSGVSVAAAIANKAAREFALARELQKTGLAVLQRLQAVVAAPTGDPVADEARVLSNLRPLMRINPDRETLTGLLTGATRMLQHGVALERRALESAATASKGLTPANMPPGQNATLAQEFLSKMDEPTRAKIREWAIEAQRLRRQAQIDAVTKSGGGSG